MNTPNPHNGDGDEAFADGDDQVDWANVDQLADQYVAVLAIADDDERLAAARALTAAIGG